MNNSEFFRIRTCSLNPTTSRRIGKEVSSQKPKTVSTVKRKGILSLLEGSSKSHCNTFVGYSRIPHKYDHFHEKTLPSVTISSFIQSSSPKRPEIPKNLISLSESLDITQAKIFFTNQQVYQKIFDANKIPYIKKQEKLHNNKIL